MAFSLKRGLLLAIVAFATAAVAWADTYPSRSITIMPLLAAGTGLDVTVRLYAEQLSQSLGKPVVVENKPGSAGLAGIAALKAAAADGYTLIVATSAVMAIRPTLLKSAPYDAQKDFIPIALYVKSPFILVVDPKLPIRSVPELIAYVKERPGKISYSSSGVGGAPHLSAEYMKQRFGIDLAHVPYRNSPQSIADVAAGHVALAFAEAGASLPLIRDGKLRALAVTSSTRLSNYSGAAAVRRGRGRARLRDCIVACAARAKRYTGRSRCQAARRDEADHGSPRYGQESREHWAHSATDRVDRAAAPATSPPKTQSGAHW